MWDFLKLIFCAGLLVTVTVFITVYIACTSPTFKLQSPEKKYRFCERPYGLHADSLKIYYSA